MFKLVGKPSDRQVYFSPRDRPQTIISNATVGIAQVSLHACFYHLSLYCIACPLFPTRMEKFNGGTTKYTKVERKLRQHIWMHLFIPHVRVCPLAQIQYLPSSAAAYSELCSVLQFIECARVDC